ncbi:MAG: nucleotidyltransferase domain-containing protein [Verrucomicrobia bacterium]|nr:nucleotidyltransferase domain-containing protein [Verrucomicrobiota bacterium]
MKEKLRLLIEYFKDALPGLRGIYLFGSAVTNELDSESDIDIAVLLNRALTAGEVYKLTMRAVDLFDRPVDIIEYANRNQSSSRNRR